MSSFGSDLGQLSRELAAADPGQSTLAKKRRDCGQVYTVHWAQLRDFLQASARFDPHSAM